MLRPVLYKPSLLVEKDSSQLAAQFDRLQELARNALGEIQVLASQLRTRSLAEEGLAAALHRLADERHRRDGLLIRLEVSGRSREKGLSEPVVTGLYRIAQEALNNVAKYARATQVSVNLRLSPDSARLMVIDDGVGFDPAAIPPNHLGLRIMRERAEAIGARLNIYSEPGEGTQVTVVWQKSPD